MKKTISGVLLALTAVFALVACGKKDKTTAASGDKKVTPNGKVINFYCWNNEFQTRLRKYYPGYEKNLSAQADLLKDGTTIMWTMVANQGGSYQTALDAALESDSVDMFVFEADYATKYVKSKYVVDMSTLGIDQSKQYKYTVDVVTNAEGKVVGSSWQGCPGCICYNNNVAKAVFGDSISLEDMTAKLSTDKNKFDETAAALEAKDAKYAMLIGPACWYRTYSNNLSAKMYDGTNITVDKNIFQYAVDTLDYENKGYILGVDDSFGLWQDDWGAGMSESSNALCVFACPWFTDFCLNGYCKTDGVMRVTPGYVSWFWGGTWLTATPKGVEDATKKAAITDIIKEMTTNKDVLLALSRGELDFTNNQEAMEALAADASAANAYFGGQNTYAIYAKSVLKADMSKNSDYDQQVAENFQSAFLPYIQGTKKASECWATFQSNVKTATKIEPKAATGVTIGDDITIA